MPSLRRVPLLRATRRVWRRAGSGALSACVGVGLSVIGAQMAFGTDRPIIAILDAERAPPADMRLEALAQETLALEGAGLGTEIITQGQIDLKGVHRLTRGDDSRWIAPLYPIDATSRAASAPAILFGVGERFPREALFRAFHRNGPIGPELRVQGLLSAHQGYDAAIADVLVRSGAATSRPQTLITPVFDGQVRMPGSNSNLRGLAAGSMLFGASLIGVSLFGGAVRRRGVRQGFIGSKR